MTSDLYKDITSEDPSYRVLLVDDERHIVRLLHVNLERQGYLVSCAFDGVEALERVLSDKPHVVTLEVMMPFMDGFEVLKTLRRDPRTENLPVMMLTAKAQEKYVFEGYHYGADMYLTKPFNPYEINRLVSLGLIAAGPRKVWQLEDALLEDLLKSPIIEFE